MQIKFKYHLEQNKCSVRTNQIKGKNKLKEYIIIIVRTTYYYAENNLLL
jgi:hypothetical protein